MDVGTLLISNRKSFKKQKVSILLRQFALSGSGGSMEIIPKKFIVLNLCGQS